MFHPHKLVSEVLSAEELQLIEYRYDELKTEWKTEEALLMWLAKNGLILNELQCRQCDSRMRINKVSAGPSCLYKWRCYVCNSTMSIRHCSIFASTKLPLATVMYLIYFWCFKFNKEQSAEWLQLPLSTVSEWYFACRLICGCFLSHLSTPIGGIRHVVEIASGPMVTDNTRRGNCRNYWIVAGVDRTDGEVFILPVTGGGSNSITMTISKQVRPESRVITDGSPKYSNLNQLGFEHEVVEASEQDTEDIQEDNVRLSPLALRGAQEFISSLLTVQARALSSYVHEYAWRRKYEKNQFSNMIICIRKTVHLLHDVLSDNQGAC